MKVATSAARARATPSTRHSATTAPTYLLHLPVDKLIRLLRAEITRADGAPELYVDAYQDYIIEEEYDRALYPLPDGSQYDLVTAEAVLHVEPRLEQNYWVLSAIVHKELGPQHVGAGSAFLGGPLTLDAFEKDFLTRRDAVVSVRLETDTLPAKVHFDQWWADLNARHPLIQAGIADAAHTRTSAHRDPDRRDAPKAADSPAAGAWSDSAREALPPYRAEVTKKPL